MEGGFYEAKEWKLSKLGEKFTLNKEGLVREDQLWQIPMSLQEFVSRYFVIQDLISTTDWEVI